jgi:hypothetical protein
MSSEAVAGLIGPEFPPPGDVTFSSSGTSIGAEGGVTFSFSDFNLGAASALYWGARDANAVGLALDGEINDSDEFLTLSIDGVGVAIGVGSTEISTTPGVTPVATMFRLTIRDAVGNSVPLITTNSVGLGFDGVNEELFEQHLDPEDPVFFGPTTEWDTERSHDRLWS